MESNPGYTINPDYALAENDIPDRFLAALDAAADLSPSNVNGNGDWTLVHDAKPNETYWTWRKGAENETSIYMKVIFDFEGVNPYHLWQALQIDHRKNWEVETPLIEKVEDLADEQNLIIFQHLRKIPIPMVDQRDLVYKQCPRANYLVADGKPSIHVTARESVEHSSKPAGAVAGFTRALYGVSGSVIEQTATGARMTSINHTDLAGQIPTLILNQAATGAPGQMYDQISAYMKVGQFQN